MQFTYRLGQRCSLPLSPFKKAWVPRVCISDQVTASAEYRSFVRYARSLALRTADHTSISILPNSDDLLDWQNKDTCIVYRYIQTPTRVSM